MAENNTPRNDRPSNGSRNGKTRKIETLQLRRLMRQEKENRELRKQMTTLLNYQKELEKRIKDSVDVDEEIRKNNASIDKLLKENQKYERALQSAQEKLDEEQSDFYRIALQDNTIELNRLKQLNDELRQGNRNTEERLEDMHDTMENMNETFNDNLQSLIDSFNIMAIKDSMDEGIGEINKSMIDITNSLHLSEDEADAFKKVLSDNLKEFNKLNNNMLNSTDMQDAVATLIEAGITDTNKIIEFWESVAVADKLGYDLGSHSNILNYSDSEYDLENIVGTLTKTKGMDNVDTDALLSGIDTIMPSISHLSDEEQARIINEYVSGAAVAQSQGIEGMDSYLADFYADMYSYDPSKADYYAEKYGANAQYLTLDPETATDKILGQVDMAGYNNAMLESYGWTEEMIDSANKTNANGDVLNKKVDELAQQDSIESLNNTLDDYHTSVLDSLKNQISPYLMSISNAVSSWGLDWSDISGIYLTGKGIWDIVKGIGQFLGIGAGISTTATTVGGAGAGAAGTGGILATISGGLSSIVTAIGGIGGAVALAIPAAIGAFGIYETKKQNDHWNSMTKEEQDEYLDKQVQDYLEGEHVIKDNTKSTSQFDANGAFRNGLDNVPIDGFKAILHSGEAVLTRDEAQKYRANPDILNYSEKDLEVFSKNIEAMNRNDQFAQRTLSVLNKLKSPEVLGKARESAKAVFDRLKSSNPSSDPTTGGEFDSSGDYAKDTWNYLVSKGYSKQATAGILGNMYQESGVDPTRIQDNGKGPAAGICQWENYNTKSKRWKSMSDYASSKGKPWTDLQSQLDWLDLEMQGKDPTTLQHLKRKVGGYDAFKNMTDVRQATLVFEESFERAGKPNMNRRYTAAEGYYNDFAKYEQGTPYVPTDQIALLHKGEMVVPKDQNPMNSGRVISTSNEDIKEDLKSILQVLQWGFEYLGKKFGEEKVVMQSTAARKLDTLNDRYHSKKLGR